MEAYVVEVCYLVFRFGLILYGTFLLSSAGFLLSYAAFVTACTRSLLRDFPRMHLVLLEVQYF